MAETVCPACDGKGERYEPDKGHDYPCGLCGGTGVVPA